MNELTWKSLGVFFSVYQETGDMLSAEVDAKALETKLKKNAQEVFDAVASLRHEDYVTGLTHNTWRITREGIKAWESRQADATPNTDPPTKSEQETKGPEGVDGLLVSLVRQANGTKDFSQDIPITVAVGGLLISGMLISYKRYREEYTRQHVQRMETSNVNLPDFIGTPEELEETRANLKSMIRETSQKILGKQLAEIRASSALPERFETLCLLNARAWAPGGPTPFGLWRVRLDQVDGFTLGTFGD